MTRGICDQRPPSTTSDQTIQPAPRKGFWSYVTDDDTHEQGRIRQLAEDVASEYEATTGESVDLFFSGTDLEWGDDWPERIDEALESAAFFIPVITPRFFQSIECRRELQRFLDRAEALGTTELLLPIYYLHVEALHGELPENHPDRELLATIRKTQWTDWTDLRFKARSSEEYRRAVAKLVGRIVEAGKKIESGAREPPAPAALALATPSTEEEPATDAPGELDHLADLEHSLPAMTEAIEEIGGALREARGVMDAMTAEVNNAPAHRSTFAYRKNLASQLAHNLEQPADRLTKASQELATHTRTADSGTRIMLQKAAEAIASGSPEEQAAGKNILSVTRKAAGSIASMNDAGRNTLKTLPTLTKLSKDLRPVGRRIAQAVTVIIEAGEVSQGWVALIDRLEGS